jgi:hypothetical protein
VVIDREGIIRAQSRPIGETSLENETYLRNLVDTLLKEGSASWTSKVSSVSPIVIMVILGSVLVWRMKQKRQ